MVRRAHRIRAAALLLIATALAACAPATRSPASPVTRHVTRVGTPPHILVVLEENHGYGDIIGNAQLPYINSLASQYGLATAWSGVSHPSLPNYLALISGSIQNNPQDTAPSAGTYGGPTLVDELAAAGIGWRAYMEDLPRACDLQDTYGPNNYDVNHDPFVYFDSIRGSAAQCGRVAPFGQLASDLSSGAAPPFLWVSPNTQDDMHNGTYQQGDQWLRSLMATVTQSAWWAQGGQLVLTWDEGESGAQIATIVVGPAAQGGKRLTSSGNHYGTLRALEEAYGVGLLGASASASNGDLSPLLSASSPTATPAPSTPEAISGVPCTVTLGGAQQAGTCTGTFRPATPAP